MAIMQQTTLYVYVSLYVYVYPGLMGLELFSTNLCWCWTRKFPDSYFVDWAYLSVYLSRTGFYSQRHVVVKMEVRADVATSFAQASSGMKKRC